MNSRLYELAFFCPVYYPQKSDSDSPESEDPFPWRCFFIEGKISGGSEAISEIIKENSVHNALTLRVLYNEPTNVAEEWKTLINVSNANNTGLWIAVCNCLYKVIKTFHKNRLLYIITLDLNDSNHFFDFLIVFYFFLLFIFFPRPRSSNNFVVVFRRSFLHCLFVVLLQRHRFEGGIELFLFFLCKLRSLVWIFIPDGLKKMLFQQLLY